MKISVKFSFLLLFFAIIFISCEKEDFKKEKDWKSEKCECEYKEDDWKKDCFEFIYPISFTMPDGSIISMNDEEDWDAIKEWYEANEDSEEKPELNFPVDVMVEEETITLENEEDLELLEKECWEEKEWDEFDCFEFVYPVSFMSSEGSSFTVDGEGDWEALKEWFEENASEESEPDFVYPFDISIEEETITILNEEEFDEVLEACKDEWDEDDCENHEEEEEEEEDDDDDDE